MEEKISCIICGYEAKTIVHHLKHIHKISSDEYKKTYNAKVLSESFLETIRNNGNMASETVDDRVYRHKCKMCENIIDGKDLICVTCKLKRAREKKEVFFLNKQENVDFVRCKCKLENGDICGWPDTRLTVHIRHHNYTSQRYKSEFGDCLSYPDLKNKTAFRGTHSEETRLRMSNSHQGCTSWNKGLTKETNDSVKIISEKAQERCSQLANNYFHNNPRTGSLNGNFGKSTWKSGLNAFNSELVDLSNEQQSGLYHHRSLISGTVNDFIIQFELDRKSIVRESDKKCMECGCDTELIVHHIMPKRSFNYYDVMAHNYKNLITLCVRCHSSKAQAIDRAILTFWHELDKKAPEAYEYFNKWKEIANKRKISMTCFSKRLSQMLPEDMREKMAIMLFDELRDNGFPYPVYDDDMLKKDLEYVKTKNITITDNQIRNYISSGHWVRKHFIRQQFELMLPFFNNDEKLLKVIRNRLGLGWNGEPEFFDITTDNILRGMNVIFPESRFSQYSTSIAKWVIENFCEGKRIYDYSAGWGSRAIAASVLGKDYTAVDTNEKLVIELNEMAKWLRIQNNECLINIEHADASKYLPKEIDLAYSCPPYAMVEDYNGMTFNNEKQWLDEYLIPVINNCHQSLRVGGKFVCHIGNKYGEILKNSASEKFYFIKSYDIINHGHPFNNVKEKKSEVIFVFEKRS